jgi:hypothetical protein
MYKNSDHKCANFPSTSDWMNGGKKKMKKLALRFSLLLSSPSSPLLLPPRCKLLSRIAFQSKNNPTTTNREMYSDIELASNTSRQTTSILDTNKKVVIAHKEQ